MANLSLSPTLLFSSTRAPRPRFHQRNNVFELPARRAPGSIIFLAKKNTPLLVAATASSSSDNDSDPSSPEQLKPQIDSIDLNQIQTALNNAIASENYDLAAKIRDVLALAISADGESSTDTAPSGDWRRLGIIEWISDRAEDLGYRLPTEVQRRASHVILDRKDCVIEAATGSGKTLAFLLPALSLLRYPPDLYVDDLQGPGALIIVPTRELGVQAVMLVYKLFGGSINPGVPGERANMFRYHGPRGLKVKGLLLPDEVEMAVLDRYIAGAHVVVGTPDLVAEALERGVEVAQYCEVVVVDEVDACYSEYPQQMELIMKAALGEFSVSTNKDKNASSSGSGGGSSIVEAIAEIYSLTKSDDEIQEEEGGGGGAGADYQTNDSEKKKEIKHHKPEIVLVGATLDDSLVERTVALKWVQDPIQVTVGKRMQVPAGLRHRYIAVAGETAKVGAMCRQLREDLKSGSQDAAPARVMLFAENETQARALSDPLRTVLWGEHAISVLLPGGNEPIKALHSFRDNQTTLLLATPAAARGLDLPAVSHVYSLSTPTDAADYLHRAGRAGRIGSPVRGLITTMVMAGEEEEALLAIAEKLNIKLIKEEALSPPGLGGDGESVSDVEEAKRSLEAVLAFSPDLEDEN